MFATLIRRYKWGNHHQQEVRTRLARALAHAVPALACVINPMARHLTTTNNNRVGLIFLSNRSHCGRFTLHGCLPVQVRQRGPTDARYQLLCRVGEGMADDMKSVSRELVGLGLGYGYLHGYLANQGMKT